MRDYRGILVVIVLIVVMSFIFLNVVIPSNEDGGLSITKPEPTQKSSSNEVVTITPTDEVGKGIRTLKDDNSGYLASINDISGEVYYFNNRSTVINYYDKVNGNYSSPFKAQYRNATVNGQNNSHVIIKIL